jgi:aminomethyltransferase
METASAQVPGMMTLLDRFIIMDDVELSRVTGDRAGLLLAGPQATRILQRFEVSAAQPAPIGIQSLVWKNNPLDILCVNSPPVPTFELWSDLTTILELDQALTSAGATPVSPAALEAVRILSGTPRYGIDIRNTDKAHDLPQEAAQDQRALNFAKGCYLGQEIVERIRSRGSVHRTFTGFVLSGALPPAGTELTTESVPRPVGELTSVVAIPDLADPNGPPLQLALGYIRREALDLNLPLTYPGGNATPASLPFALPPLTSAQP